MAKTNTRKPAAAKTVAPAQQAASPMPTPTTAVQTAAAPKPATVALRGGPAVAQVRLTGKAYRTAAPHNQQWWKQLSEAGAGDKAVAVADVVVSQQKPNGVPAHFVGYCIRRGYLQAVAQ